MTLISKNAYGNVDIREGVPMGLVHFSRERLQPLCRKIGIDYAEAMTGFTSRSKKYGYKPVMDGVVVWAKDANKLRDAINEMDARAEIREERAIKAKARKQEKLEQKWNLELATRWPGMPDEDRKTILKHTLKVGSGRVGRSTTAEDPVKAAVIAHIRHVHTLYEALFSNVELVDRADFMTREEYLDARREEARRQVAEDITEIYKRWEGANG